MRSLRWLVAPVIAAIVLLFGSSSAYAAPHTSIDSATIEKSVVSLTINWSGKVRYPTNNNGEDVTDAIDLKGHCTGFFVSKDGDIVTAGHCVDPEEVKISFINAAIKHLQEDGRLTGTIDKDYIYQNWTPEGASKGSQPLVQVRVSQADDVNAPVSMNDRPAQIIAVDPSNQGDVALLKLSGVTGTVPLAVAAQAPAIGTPVTSVGFPAILNTEQDVPNQRASFKSGEVSSVQTTDDGIPRIEVSSELSHGMSGGPTVDLAGNVVGVNSRGFTSTGQGAFNFITDPGRLTSYLTAHGVTANAPRATVAPSASGQASPGPVVSVAPVSSDSSPSGAMIALGVVVVLAAIGGGLFFRNRQARPAPAAVVSTPVASGTALCSYGHFNLVGAQFCSTCGTALKTT